MLPAQALMRGLLFSSCVLKFKQQHCHNNAALLKTRIGQYQSVGNVQNGRNCITTMSVKSEGNLTVAKLYGSIAEYWSTFDKWNGSMNLCWLRVNKWRSYFCLFSLPVKEAG